jgi:hypothetical protein
MVPLSSKLGIMRLVWTGHLAWGKFYDAAFALGEHIMAILSCPWALCTQFCSINVLFSSNLSSSLIILALILHLT